MTTREAARPLRRYLRARVRAASLPPTYTITRDVTPAAPKQRPPAESKPASDAELAVPVPSARQRAIDAVVTSPEKSDRRIAAETGLDRATIARARGQLDEYQPVDMPRAETPQSSEPDPDPPREPALRDEKGRFVRPDIARIDAVSEPPGSDTLVPD